jgi:hypothetical protein
MSKSRDAVALQQLAFGMTAPQEPGLPSQMRQRPAATAERAVAGD